MLSEHKTKNESNVEINFYFLLPIIYNIVFKSNDDCHVFVVLIVLQKNIVLMCIC